jgi:hypothetical protein
MTSARAELAEDRMQSTIDELTTTIARAFPGTTFTVSHPEDEPASIEITAIVDVDDPDDVLDLVIERVVHLQVEESVPIHGVPIRTPERIEADRAERRRAGRRP